MKFLPHILIAAASLACAAGASAQTAYTKATGEACPSGQRNVELWEVKKDAKAACDAQSGNAKKVCVEEARVARAKADSDAVAQYRNTPRELSKARKDVAKAEYDLTNSWTLYSALGGQHSHETGQNDKVHGTACQLCQHH